MEFSLENEQDCPFIDPDGPIRWLDNDSLLGRQWFGPKNNLVLMKFLPTGSIAVRIPVGFVFSLDHFEVSSDGLSVTVTSSRDKKTNVVDMRSRKVRKTRKFVPGWSAYRQKFLDLDLMIFSPNHRRVAKRVYDPDGKLLLRIYDFVA